MFTSVSPDIGTLRGAGGWPGAVWRLPELSFPGPSRRAVALYCQDPRPARKIRPQGLKRFGLAMLTQAIADGSSKLPGWEAEQNRESALDWLRDVGPEFFRMAGLGVEVDETDIKNWIAKGCPPMPCMPTNYKFRRMIKNETERIKV